MKSIKIKVLLAFTAVAVAACVSVRQADLDAWQNVPVIELESHPIFNAMDLEKKPLSDGSTLWSFTKHGGTYQKCHASSQTSGSSVKEEKKHKSSYDTYGYDSRGYNRYGYDRYGYDKYGYNDRGYNKQGVKRKTEVTNTHDSTYSNSNCETGEYICVNQFLVNKSGIVQWYHPTGNNCRTDCSYRPRSRPCPK